ncbi:MAG: helix-turn-helix transcriptional regulator [Cyclobacteriaceae bacterium]
MEKRISSVIGQRFKNIRGNRTQEEFGVVVGKTSVQISRIETGKSKPSKVLIDKMIRDGLLSESDVYQDQNSAARNEKVLEISNLLSKMPSRYVNYFHFAIKSLDRLLEEKKQDYFSDGLL